MDFTSFKAAIEAAHRAEAKVGAATFHLRMPSDHLWRATLEANRDAEGRVLEAQAFRALLNTAIVDWADVRTTDILPGATDEPLPFSAAARAELLDARQDIADEVTVQMAAFRRLRREQLETARKNSSRASSGS